jgi:putative DNA primase/helicase
VSESFDGASPTFGTTSTRWPDLRKGAAGESLRPCPGFGRLVAALFEPDDLVELRALPEPVKRRWLRAEQVPKVPVAPAWRGTNIHFGPNPRRRKGGTAADVALARCLFVDIERVTAQEAAASVAGAGLPDPTAIVSSGGGVHVYWRLAEPLTDLDIWTARQKALIAALGSDPVVHDSPRVMRLPGTLNHKYNPPRPCAVVACYADVRHPLDAFPDALPQPSVVIDPPPRAWSGSTSELERRAAAYLDRIPAAIAGHGGHGQTYAAATALVHGFGIEPAVAFALLRHQYNPRCQPPWTDRELMHKVDDAASKPHDRPFGYLRDADRPPDSPSAEAPRAKASPSEEQRPIGRRLRVRSLADIEPTAIRWLWPGRIALGKITMLAGQPGLGKSFLTCDLAARVSAGLPWPDGGDPCPQGQVLILNGEDDPSDTIRPRLDAAHADVSKVHFIDGVDTTREGELDPFELARDTRLLRGHIEARPDVRLLVIDPVSAYIGQVDDHRNSEVRGLLRPLAELAHDEGVAIVLVTHLNKSVGEAINRIIGSIAWAAAARAAWAVIRDPDDDDRRLLLSLKNNIARESLGMAYRIVGPPGDGMPAALSGVGRIEWESEPLSVRADDVLGAPRGEGVPNRAPARAEAANFLRELLKNSPVASEQIKIEAKAAGVAWAAVRRAKEDLRIVPRKSGFGENARWCWVLPDASSPRGSEGAHGEHSP